MISKDKSKLLQQKRVATSQQDPKDSENNIELVLKEGDQNNEWILNDPIEKPLQQRVEGPQSEDSLKEIESLQDIRTEKLSAMSSVSIQKLKKEALPPKNSPLKQASRTVWFAACMNPIVS